MRKPLFVANWKMNKTVVEAIALAKALKNEFIGMTNREIVICPPFTALAAVAAEIKIANILLGAQNMHYEKEGAFTGEISPVMLKEIGVKYVILGHSERRHYFNESNELINKKLKSAAAFGLNPIFCVGETSEEREKKKTKAVIEKQIVEGLRGISEFEMQKINIAYEPVWAIGTGKNASPKQAENVHLFIRGIVKKLYYKRISDNLRILYGGSVNPENVEGFMEKSSVDGVLVGGASLDEKKFIKIVKYDY